MELVELVVLLVEEEEDKVYLVVEPQLVTHFLALLVLHLLQMVGVFLEEVVLTHLLVEVGVVLVDPHLMEIVIMAEVV